MTGKTFGEVRWHNGIWEIQCEPHVRARLKRVFPRAPQHAASVICLSATPENTRELEWFLQRYPMRVDDAKRMKRLAREHREAEAELQKLLWQRTPPTPVGLAIPARDYQALLVPMMQIRDGLLLADDLGLGKSISGMCPMLTPGNLPALVVCPAHLPGLWDAMLARFLPQLRRHVLRKKAPYDLAKGASGAGQVDMFAGELPDVIVTSYHKLAGWAEILAGSIRYVVFDECQALRHPTTGIYAAAKHVAQHAPKRMGLSNTPIHNYGDEFYNVLDVLEPGSLGTNEEFQREWCTTRANGKAMIADTERFGAYLRSEGLMLHRTRAQVGRELPPLTTIVHEIEGDAQAAIEADSNAATLARIILDAQEQHRGQKMQAAGEFDVLVRQATGLAKAPYVARFVDMLMESGERIVLFGWHRAVYAVWNELLKHHNPVFYTGSESTTQKAEAIAKFKSGESKLLIMSLRSGAGVDGLQGVSNISVFGELDWSPMVHKQCIGRQHRDEQIALHGVLSGGHLRRRPGDRQCPGAQARADRGSSHPGRAADGAHRYGRVSASRNREIRACAQRQGSTCLIGLVAGIEIADQKIECDFAATERAL